MQTTLRELFASFVHSTVGPATKNHVHCYCLGLDVVAYSLRTTDVQTQIVRKIQDLIAQSRTLSSLRRSELIFLPTGDGMIISLVGTDHSPLLLVDLAREIQSTLIADNVGKPADQQIVLRFGLHSGTGASYYDINKRLNIAGTVANMAQRVTQLGHDWHIIASRNAFDDIGTLDRTVQTYFQRLGFAEVKHKVLIEVYNVHCPLGDPFGNPEIPPGIQDLPGAAQTQPGA